MQIKIKNLIFSILVAISFLLELSLFEDISNLNIKFLYEINVFGISVLAIVIYYFFAHYKLEEVSFGKKLLAVLFAAFMLLGEAYVSYGSYKLLFKNPATFGFSIVKFTGYSYIFIYLFSLLDKFLKKNGLKDTNIKFKNKYLSKYLTLFNKYPFRTSFVTIMVVISLYILAFYPIVLSPDPSFQIKMYFNEHTKYIDWVIQRNSDINMTAHHPVLQTYALGLAIEIGRFLINDNFGLFLYTIVQSLIYAGVLAYSIKFLSNNKVNSKYRFILLLIYLIVPMFALYSVSAVKDTLYTAFMLLFVLKVFDIVKNYQTKPLSLKYLVILYLIMLLLSLFRHNGVYVITLTFLCLFFYTSKNKTKLLLTFVCFFLSIYSFDKVLVPSLGISDGSAREMLSVPFQQTARLVKEKPDFYTDEDKKIIDYILKYDTLAKRYNPNLADPVKNEYNKYTTTEDLKKYFKIWGKGLLKYPDIYIDATMNNVSGFFYPNQHNWYIYTKYDDRIRANDLVDYHYNNLAFLRQVLDIYANVFPYIPIFGSISNIALNTWFVFILSVYLGYFKKKKYLITLVPLYGSILFCVLGPANTYFRYTMPYIFVLPVLSMLLLKVVRGELDEEK